MTDIIIAFINGVTFPFRLMLYILGVQSALDYEKKLFNDRQ